MSEFDSWTQSNWNEIATLLVQIAFLATAAWFARNILRTMRAFQEQVGALPRLSISTPPNELNSRDAVARETVAETMAAVRVSTLLLTPAEMQTSRVPAETRPIEARAETRTVNVASQPRTIFGAEPMEMGTNESAGAWRSAVQWLQTPMRSSNAASRGRIMRWLHAPVH